MHLIFHLLLLKSSTRAIQLNQNWGLFKKLKQHKGPDNISNHSNKEKISKIAEGSIVSLVNTQQYIHLVHGCQHKLLRRLRVGIFFLTNVHATHRDTAALCLCRLGTKGGVFAHNK